jgi:hypothetical protein
MGLGAGILRLLSEPKPVSRLWEDFKKAQSAIPQSPTTSFGWFVLALDLLFLLGLIRNDHNRIARVLDDSPALQ